MNNRHLLTLVSFAALASPALLAAAPQVTSATSNTPPRIQIAADAFSVLIGAGGAINGAATGPFATGFRTINWDGVPDAAAAPNFMPGNQFVSRGILFSTPGAGLLVSADDSNPTSTPVRFGHLDASYPTRFQAFSAQRLIVASGSTINDYVFSVPSSPNTPATVNGFGVVFCDVDLANSSSLEFFDANGVSLGVWYAPVADNGLSFLGVYFGDGERVARVRATLGNLALGSGAIDTATLDVVAADDFMYSEPLPIASTSKFINVSSRARVGTGDDVLISGFVVEGTDPKAVLIRAVGPTLATFGVTGVLADPFVTVFNSSKQVIASDDNWSGSDLIKNASNAVGAFPLTAASKDAALVLVLNPGLYTVQVSGVGGSAGVALMEVYELE